MTAHLLNGVSGEDDVFGSGERREGAGLDRAARHGEFRHANSQDGEVTPAAALSTVRGREPRTVFYFLRMPSMN